MQQTIDDLAQLIRAGQAKVPATSAITGGTLVNVMSGEVYPADVALYHDTIVAVGNVDDYIDPQTTIIDATGMYLTPGLIDGHIHSECSKLSITSYAASIIPHGTTSMISGLDEYISVSGLEGLQEIFAEIKQSPLKVFWGAPHQTPYTIPQSTIACNITADTHSVIQSWPECFGVWETVREFVQEENKETLGALVQAHKNRLPIFGCAPMARGKDLNGYLCAGVRLDHESYDHEEVVEKMRNGMHMLLRESCVTRFLAENIRAATEVNPAFTRRMSFCIDDTTATEIMERGHVDNAIRQAIKAGIDPVTAIQMATINSAEAYRIDHLVGSICPGRLGDILLVSDLESFDVSSVVVEGKLVASKGAMLEKLVAPKRSELLTSKLKCDYTSPADFTYASELESGVASVLSMDVIGPFRRIRRDVELSIKDHAIQPSVEKDVALVSVIERFGKNGNKSLAFCSGWKLKRGALASSAAPDDNNLVVMGTNAQDMSIAANYLIEQGGGQVVVDGGEVVAFLPLPVGGICTDAPAEEVARMEAVIDEAARKLGCDLPDPMMYMFFLPITAIPDYAITDLGPVDCIALEVFDPVLSQSQTAQTTTQQGDAQ